MITAMLGDFVRTARERAGVTQEELAQRARVKQSTVSRMEAGAMPRADSFERIIEALGYAIHLTPFEAPNKSPYRGITGDLPGDIAIPHAGDKGE